MSNQFIEKEEKVVEKSISLESTTPNDGAVKGVTESKFTKKKLVIIGGIIIAVVVILLFVFIPSKFERVKNECVQIAGMVTGRDGSDDHFMIDTSPDIPIFNAQARALEAIKYANEELGFNGSVYSQMLKTTALMGRQSVENDKYRVSWTYHPDDGLEVTYEEK